jgi:hypothetical protein
MYRYRYINTQSQFGRTSCLLVLSDLETGMPEVRIYKEFGVMADQLDDETLYQAASIEIQNAQAAYDAWAADQAAQQAQCAANQAAEAQAIADAIAADNGD